MLTNEDVKRNLERLQKKYNNIKSTLTTEEIVADLLKGKSFSGRKEMHQVLFNLLNAKVYDNNTNGNLTINNESIRIITKKIGSKIVPSIIWNTTKGRQINL